MNKKGNIFRGPALWTLIAGVAIGAGSMYSVFSGHTGSFAMAEPPAQARPATITNSESLAALKALDLGFATLAEYASPAVVLIKSENTNPSQSMTGGGEIVKGGEGSGVIFRPDGYIVTNDHVVGGFDKVTVVLKDGREFPGKVTRAENGDIAVVKIDAKGLPTLRFADSSKVKPGQLAMAIGAPYGLENSVTIGHVSALNRQNAIPDPMSGVERFYPELIQTDAAINMGNSGGPLINVDGEVIGINSSIVSPNGGGVGIGFAISSNQARLLAETLIEKGKITRAYLGLVPVDLKDIQKADMHVQSGALVDTVASDGPAAMAGIKKGDVIVRIGDLPVSDQIDLRNSMLKYSPKTKVDVALIRDGQQKSVAVTLGEAPKVNAQIQRQQQPMPDFNQGPNGDMPDIRDFIKEFRNRQNGESTPPQERTGRVQLGVSVHDVDENARNQFHLPKGQVGAVVASVLPGSLAESLGLKPGDLITSFDGKPISSSKDLSDAVGNVKPGDMKMLGFMRVNGTTTVKEGRSVQF